MPHVEFARFSPWGHASKRTTPSEIVVATGKEVERALLQFDVLPEGPNPCHDQPGFTRVAVFIPLSRDLFDQLMNGESGYRAHYAAGTEHGETFNRALVATVAPLIIQAESLYSDKFGRPYMERSLLGRFSKFWYPKALSDTSGKSSLVQHKEELLVPHWRNYWASRPKPRNGLLAPVPAEPGVLLNGTFVNDAGEDYEQKPARSMELHERGWT